MRIALPLLVCNLKSFTLCRLSKHYVRFRKLSIRYFFARAEEILEIVKNVSRPGMYHTRSVEFQAAVRLHHAFIRAKQTTHSAVVALKFFRDIYITIVACCRADELGLPVILLSQGRSTTSSRFMTHTSAGRAGVAVFGSETACGCVSRIICSRERAPSRSSLRKKQRNICFIFYAARSMRGLY